MVYMQEAGQWGRESRRTHCGIWKKRMLIKSETDHDSAVAHKHKMSKIATRCSKWSL